MRGDFPSQLQPKPCVHDGVLQFGVGLRFISIAVTKTNAKHVDASMCEHVVWHRQHPTPKQVGNSMTTQTLPKQLHATFREGPKRGL